MVGFAVSYRVWNIIKWPMIIIGLASLSALIGGAVLLLARLTRRWPRMLHRRWGWARVAAEVAAIVAVFPLLALIGRFAPFAP